MLERLIPEAKFRRLLALAILLPLLFSAILAGVLIWQVARVDRITLDISLKRNVVAQARELRSHLIDMETGARGYSLTKNPAFLQPYRDAYPKLWRAMDTLQQMCAPQPELVQVVKHIRSETATWESLVTQFVDNTDHHQRISAADQQEEKHLLDALRERFQTLIDREESLRTDQEEAEKDEQVRTLWVAVLGVLILGGILAYGTVRLLRSVSSSYQRALAAHDVQSARAQEASNLYKLITDNSGDLISLIDEQARYTYVSPSYQRVLGFADRDLVGKPIVKFIHRDDYRHVLSQWKKLENSGVGQAVARHLTASGEWRWIEAIGTRVDNKIIGVGRDVTHRIENEQKIKDLNADLENRVAERTADLARANKELEAFSYSVSHDLRAPLRSIASFSMILQEDLEGKLDADSTDNLSRIRAAAQKMTELIDALLRFSRIARAELVRGDVDLTLLASNVVTELRRRDPLRQVDVHIHEGLAAQADPHLMRIVLENLLENAWKFTAKTEGATIEMGREDGNFFVRDNGVGFEQDYVQKVFMPFERLHTDREFPGTGIGLATTKRIIERHGGRIWAEGEVGKGAKFSFTLGE
jgi:PAS domain S-box-containing protein